MTNLAVLMTSHNRREKTLACLKALTEQDCPGLDRKIFLVDDGCNDGTAAAVREHYPEVILLPGDGNLYWNGGMRLAFGAALQTGFDFYFWLNDDTILYPGALACLINSHRKLRANGIENGIVVGSVCDPVTGELTYGGVVRRHRWRPLLFSPVTPGAEELPCETMNGNCVLIPHGMAQKIGNVDPVYLHGMGDYDYGLRARQFGGSVWVAPGFLGTCPRNSLSGSWKDQDCEVSVRFQKMIQVKGLPPGPWRVFVSRYGGPLWPIYWLSPYIRMVLNHYKDLLKQYKAFVTK